MINQQKYLRGDRDGARDGTGSSDVKKSAKRKIA